jgi:hypothetical protein
MGHISGPMIWYLYVSNAMLISRQGNAEIQPAKAAPSWLSNAEEGWTSYYII